MVAKALNEETISLSSGPTSVTDWLPDRDHTSSFLRTSVAERELLALSIHPELLVQSSSWLRQRKEICGLSTRGGGGLRGIGISQAPQL